MRGRPEGSTARKVWVRIDGNKALGSPVSSVCSRVVASAAHSTNKPTFVTQSSFAPFFQLSLVTVLFCLGGRSCLCLCKFLP